MVIPHGCRVLTDSLCVFIEHLQHEPLDRFRVHVLLNKREQLREHLIAVVARGGEKAVWVEACLAVRVDGLTETIDVDLRAVTAFFEPASKFVETADLPGVAAGLEKSVVGPDHRRRRAFRILERDAVVRLVVSRPCLVL